MMHRAILALAVALGAAETAVAQDASAALRASGQVGEQADGYLGEVTPSSAATRAQIDTVNRKRRAYYIELAARRGATIEEVAAITACELFRTKIGAGQYYKGVDGVWQQRDGITPVPLPGHCG